MQFVGLSRIYVANGQLTASPCRLAIGHQRTGLERIYKFDEAWQLRCEAFRSATGYYQVAESPGAPADRSLQVRYSGGSVALVGQAECNLI
jgi:hypothetical protein